MDVVVMVQSLSLLLLGIGARDAQRKTRLGGRAVGALTLKAFWRSSALKALYAQYR
jgi:hypothetical protein